MKRYLLILSALLGALALRADDGMDRTFRINKNLNTFNTIMRELDLFYVDTLNYDKLTRNAIDYMLHNLDPYTVYMPEDCVVEGGFVTSPLPAVQVSIENGILGLHIGVFRQDAYDAGYILSLVELA